MFAIIIGFVCFCAGAFLAALFVYSRMKLQLQTWQTKYELTQLSIDQSRAEAQNLQKTMTLQFENLAQKIFDDKSTKMTDQNYQQLNQLLSPLKERIKDFEKKVEETYSSAPT